MKQDRTLIVILLDRSGSMQPIRGDVIGGVNGFLEGQRKAPGECLVTLVQFDDQYERDYELRKIGEVAPLTRETYVPRGATALYDAICRTIDETGQKLEKLAEADRPGLVLFVISTDGLENASRKDEKGQLVNGVAAINERISRQRDVYQWQFIFLGANQDAIAEAGKLGIGAGTAISTAANAQGTAGAYAALTSNVVRARSMPGGPYMKGTALNWTSAQRATQRGAGAVEDEMTGSTSSGTGKNGNS